MSKGRIAFLVLGPLVFALFVALMISVIYPRSMTFSARWLCPEDRPDPFIVSYTTQTDDGTSTSSSLYCMGERGEFVEVGTWRPMLYTFFLVYGVTLVTFGLLWLIARLQGRRRLEPPPTPPAPVSDPLAEQQDAIIN